MTTVGRWSPNKVRERVLNGTWVPADDFETGDGMALLRPSSIEYTGTSASIGANGSVEFSACTSLSLNSVFSADYDNYMIVFDTTVSQLNEVYLRLRSSGSDNSTANSYVYQYLNAASTSLSPERKTTDKWEIGVASQESPGTNNSTTFIYGPYLSQPTAMRCLSLNSYGVAGLRDIAGTHNQSVSYDSMTIYPLSSTISGFISLYGLVGAG